MNAAVLLSALKVLGIVLLVIFAIFLALVLLILFLPIRYRFNGSWDVFGDVYDLRLDITWFLHTLHGKIWFLRNKTGENGEEGYGHELKVLWFRLIPGKDEDYADDLQDDLYPLTSEYTDPSCYSRENSTHDTGTYSDSGENASHDTGTFADTGGNCPGDQTAPSDTVYNDYSFAEKTDEEEKDGLPDDKEKDGSPEDEKIRIPERISGKIKEFASFLGKLGKKIRRAGKRAGYKISSICDKMKGLFGKARYYKELFEKESTDNALVLLRDEVLYKLKVLKPSKYRMNMLYGFDDPALTGEITGVLSLVFLSSGKNVTFTPDFEQKVFEGELFMKGGIKVITVLIILWKLYFNEDFREFYRAVRR